MKRRARIVAPFGDITMRQSRRLFGQKVLAVASSPLVFSLPSFAATIALRPIMPEAPTLFSTAIGCPNSLLAATQSARIV